ncbi:MAG: hypothetical protein ABSH33_23675 [Steroidobacteraceae bacterium]|jgi:hypothetical protein
MSQQIPPRVALWIVERCGPNYQGESLTGDLIEQFQLGKSRWWFWKEAAAAVLIAQFRRIQEIPLLPALRVVLRILMETTIVVGACAIVDQSRRIHSFREILMPHFMVTMAVLVATAAVTVGLFDWMSRQKPVTTVLKSLVAAFAVIALGFGALAWAATTRDTACQSDACACANSD